MNKAFKSYLFVSILILIGVLVALFFILRAQPKLSSPKSITYDALGERFLISNLGNHSIVAMDAEGKLSNVIKKGINNPRGITMRGQELLVTDDDKLHFIDPDPGIITKTVTIEGAKLLNDVAVDELGAIYLTDIDAECIWRLDRQGSNPTQFTSKLMQQPSSLYFDKPRRQMLVVSMGQRQPIIIFSTKTNEFSVFKDTMYSQLNGIQADDLGRIFFSSLQEQAVFMIPQAQNRFILFEQNLKSPADLYWHEPTNELLLPLTQENRIVRLALDED